MTESVWSWIPCWLTLAAQSSTFIQQSLNEHNHIEEELQTAKHLMTSFKIKNMTDKLLLVVAMVFYALVCVYVLISRLKTPFGSIFNLISYLFSSTETEVPNNSGLPSNLNVCADDVCDGI